MKNHQKSSKNQLIIANIKSSESSKDNSSNTSSKSDLQPREHFLAAGAEALSDKELLAILLRTGTEGTPVLEMASEILARHDGNLLAVSCMTVDELCTIKGMGKTKSIGLCAAFALARRLVTLHLTELPKLSHPELIAEYMREHLHSPEQEEFHAFLLDSRLCLIKDARITIGLVDRSLVHAREVFREAIREACSYVILAHNHPSGDVTPSPEDITTTANLILAGEVIGIHIIDHIIVASAPQKNAPGFFSFKNNNLLDFGQKKSPDTRKKGRRGK